MDTFEYTAVKFVKI